VFLTSDPTRVPGALLHNLKHNKVLHQRNLIVSVRTAQTPRTADEDRAEIEVLSPDFTRVLLTYGYMETPNVPKALAALRSRGVQLDLMTTSFFVGRRTFVIAHRSHMLPGMDRLYIWLAKNAADPTDFFHVPVGRVVELGTQLNI
jgi:KUP system potassium uptake protein